MSANQIRRLGGGLLLFVLLPLGCFLVPAHFVSIWMDVEFTDWISPIANRLHNGARLYEFGLHTPMPPLPYVLVHLLHPGQALWIQESRLNFGFQAANLMLLYAVLSRHFNTAVSFAAVMAAVPIYFSLGKTMLYYSLAQFLVVACAAGCLGILAEIGARGNPLRKFSFWLRLGAEGLLITLLLLAKQSTGVGVFLGVGSALLIFPAAKSLRVRLLNAAIVGALTIAAFCVMGLIMSPWVSFPGMIHDVFATGSEPKGGSGVVLFRLILFCGHLAFIALIVGLLIFGLGKIRNRNGSVGDILDWIANAFAAPPTPRIPVRSSNLPLVIGAVLATLAGLLLVSVPSLVRMGIMERIYFYLCKVAHLPRLILSFGLGAGVWAALALLIAGRRRPQEESRNYPLAVLVMIFVPAALFHSLSVHVFRWYYDNNPLIVVALLCFISPFVEFYEAARSATKRLARLQRAETNALVTSPIAPQPGADGAARHPYQTRTLPLASLLLGLAVPAMFIYWPVALATATVVAECTQTWPEIAQLKGAKMRPKAAGMRSLAKAVNDATSPGDTVLLLPEDPNVQEWFKAKRPELSCAIVFTDQYWDRYVDEDFKRLSIRQPKIIIIGPHDFWREFTRMWHQDVGCERLTDLVINKLIPEDYELLYRQEIVRWEHPPDFMDVYRLRAGVKPGQ